MAYSINAKDYFNTKLWTGNSTNSTAITGVGFQPDMTWIKNRNQTDNHAIFDAIRGATYRIYPNASDAQIQATNSLASFDSDGFTLNDGGDANGNGENIVGWNWKANGQGSSNTDGSINTTYTSVNTTAGFSISKWTGNSTAGATIGHGLGVKPSLIIIKNLGASSQWLTWFDSFANTEMIYLNLTNAKGTGQTYFNSTTPTSSLITLGGGVDENRNTMVAYCFAEKTGFSKFGSYTGNGNADGPMIYTGFKPAFYLWKPYNATDSWNLVDSKREGYNPDNNRLFPNSNTSEDTQDRVDLVSNGIKIKTSDGGTNSSSRSYIYMAFAEAPLVGSNNVPCTAR